MEGDIAVSLRRPLFLNLFLATVLISLLLPDVPLAADGGGPGGINPSRMSAGPSAVADLPASVVRQLSGSAEVSEAAAQQAADQQSAPEQSSAPVVSETVDEAAGEADTVDDALFLELDADDPVRSAVARAKGQRLKRFGLDFFGKRGASPADPLAQVGPDYVLGPGDTLNIMLWGAVEASHTVRVDRNGEVSLPRVGVISLWGQTFDQAQRTIRNQISKYYTNFELNVTMGALRSIQVFLVGEVRSPGAYHISSLSTVLSALSAAGGPKTSGSLRQIELVRGGQSVATIDLYDFFLTGDQSGNVRLQSGDTLFVPLSGPLVGVRGEVRRPAIYELQGEQTLAEVLELAGGLVPSAYLQKVTVQRLEAHERRKVIDLDVGHADTGAFAVQDRDLIQVSPISSSGGFVTLRGYVTRPGQYQLFPEMRLADLILPYDNLLPEYYPDAARIVRTQPPEYRPEVMTVHLQQALDGDPEHNILLQEFDQVELYSRQQMEESLRVRIEGAVLQPGTYPYLHNMTVRDLVTVAGQLRRSAFVDQAEIIRYVSDGRQGHNERILFDLDLALAGDPDHNLTLQADDHLFIRSIPDFVEREVVQIKGEVLYPGTYAIARGESLSSVIERAGGFTDQAYLRGAVFTRESVRRLQQQRLNELINEQEQQLMRASAEAAGGALSEEDAQVAESMLTMRQAALQKLRDTPATGRMVVQLTSLDQLRGSPYDIALTGGDALTVPANPRTVMVLGQVFNPVTLVHTPGSRVADYLDQVGGTRSNANTKEMYIVRADGTVFSSKQAGSGLRWDQRKFGWTFGGFGKTPMYPGDVLLVPEKYRQTYVMRELKDLTQILYQIALGAAAIATF